MRDNKLYLLLKSGKYVCSGCLNEPYNSSLVEYDKENEIVLAENVKDVGKNVYLTNDNALYSFTDNRLIAENVREINVIFEDIQGKSSSGYITTNNELYRLEDNVKIKESIKEVVKYRYYITTNNDLYKFMNNEKIGENVKKVFIYTIQTGSHSYRDISCYITNNNELFLFDGTKLAENVKEVYNEGNYITLDNELYNSKGTKIDEDVKMFIGGYEYDKDEYQYIFYYLTDNNDLYYYKGTQKTLIANNVKSIFTLKNKENVYSGDYYVTNDNRIFDMKGETYSEEQIRERENQWNNWHEDENGKIFYWYSGHDSTSAS